MTFEPPDTVKLYILEAAHLDNILEKRALCVHRKSLKLWSSAHERGVKTTAQG